MPTNAKNDVCRVLIIEDEIAIREMVSFALTSAGFKSLEAGTTQEASQLLQQIKPDLILLDWMLPGGSGIKYIQELKKNSRTQNIPIIMLTARAEEHNKITGLESGADDYITKPFSPKELVARIKSVLRRGGNIIDNIFYANKLRINTHSHEVFFENQKINLTALEYKLLYFLMTHPKKIYSREQILDQVWPDNQDITSRSVDAQIKRLRHKLKPFECDDWILTIRGAGYQFREKSNEKS